MYVIICSFATYYIIIIMYIYNDLFIQSTVDGHLGCLPFRLLYQSCSENVSVSFSGEVKIYNMDQDWNSRIIRNIYLPICWKMSNYFLNWCYQLTTAKNKNSLCSTSSPIFNNQPFSFPGSIQNLAEAL